MLNFVGGGNKEKNMQNGLWRLVRTVPARGAWNMAVDEAILEAVVKGESLPTLRLYSWEPACLSLGLAQPVQDVDRSALAQHGWDLVRRPTGGRAILHTDELTYSVTARQDEPRVSGSVLESYSRLSLALLAALNRLSLPARADKEYALPEGSRPNAAVCFEVPSNYEITVNGKKLIGSAQARRKEGVLQHGSLPLCGDLTRITQALAYPDKIARAQAAARLLDHAATIEMVGLQVTWEQAVDAFAAGFRDTLNLEFQESELSTAELRRAEELVTEKYGNSSWTERL
jgi:lipoyl(octanoyl) transferase